MYCKKCIIRHLWILLRNILKFYFYCLINCCLLITFIHNKQLQFIRHNIKSRTFVFIHVYFNIPLNVLRVHESITILRWLPPTMVLSLKNSNSFHWSFEKFWKWKSFFAGSDFLIRSLLLARSLFSIPPFVWVVCALAITITHSDFVSISYKRHTHTHTHTFVDVLPLRLFYKVLQLNDRRSRCSRRTRIGKLAKFKVTRLDDANLLYRQTGQATEVEQQKFSRLLVSATERVQKSISCSDGLSGQLFNNGQHVGHRKTENITRTSIWRDVSFCFLEDHNILFCPLNAHWSIVVPTKRLSTTAGTMIVLFITWLVCWSTWFVIHR